MIKVTVEISHTEFILETEPDERGIIIGVSLARDDYGLDEITKFWGYILSDAVKCQMIHRKIMEEYVN